MNKIIKELVQSDLWSGKSPFRCSLTVANKKLCVITGPNVSGKSLLRKVLHHYYADQKMTYVNLSQQGRTTSGIERVFLYGDQGEDSTGYGSIKTLFGAIRSGQGYTTPFAIMLDEPEIGCSEEVQAAIGDRIVRDLDTMPQLHAFYVITHGREVVRHLLPANPSHCRMADDGMTLEQFVQRSIEPADLEKIVEVGHERWRFIEKRLEDNRKKR